MFQLIRIVTGSILIVWGYVQCNTDPSALILTSIGFALLLWEPR